MTLQPISKTVSFLGTTVGEETIFADGFEDGSLTEYTQSTGYSATQTRPFNGSFSCEYDGSASGNNLLRSFTAQAVPKMSAWVYVNNVSNSGDRPQFKAVSSGGNNVFALTIDDGATAGSQGEIIYYNGTAWQTTGIAASGGAYYKWIVENIDYSNEQYDIRVLDNTSTQIGTFSNASFWDSSSNSTEVRFLSDGVQFWIDELKVYQA